MTETTTTTPDGREFDIMKPFGDDTGRLEHVNTFRAMIVEHAQEDGRRLDRMLDDLDEAGDDWTDGEQEALATAHHAAFYGYSLVSLLRWVFDTYGVGAVFTAAQLVERIAVDGGGEPGELWTAGVNLEPLWMPAEGDATEASR